LAFAGGIKQRGGVIGVIADNAAKRLGEASHFILAVWFLEYLAGPDPDYGAFHKRATIGKAFFSPCRNLGGFERRNGSKS